MMNLVIRAVFLQELDDRVWILHWVPTGVLAGKQLYHDESTATVSFANQGHV